MTSLRSYIGAVVAAALAAGPLAALPAGAAVAVRPGASGFVTRADVRDLGRVPATTGVPVVATLAYRHPAELAQLIAAQADPRSPLFRRYLTGAQFEAYFAPSPQDYARALATFERAGLHVVATSSNRTVVDAVAPASAVEKYFTTELHRVLQNGAGTRTASATPLVIPAELRTLVATVTAGDLLVARPAFRLAPSAGRRVVDARTVAVRRAAASCLLGIFCPSPTPAPTAPPTPRPSAAPSATPSVAPTATPTGGGGAIGGPLKGPDNGYGPVAVANGYDLPVQHGFDGSGRATGVTISGDFSEQDLATYLAYFGVKRTGPATTRVAVDGGAAYNASFSSSNASVEATLDVETIVGQAPGTHLVIYLIPDLSSKSIEDGYNRVVADGIVDVNNSSFGGCETGDTAFDNAVEQIAQQAAAKGITFAASSGDSGSAECGTSFFGVGGSTGVSAPASAPHVVAVGGTTLSVGANGSYASESAWSGSGGGTSTVFAEPSYQSAFARSTGGRNVPDIAYTADPSAGDSLYFGGAWNGPIGGTSWSAPVYAAVQTEIDQRQGTRSGFVNPRIYNAFAAHGYGAFHDVTSGNNGAFAASPGYDEVTGIGSTQSFAFSGVE